MNKTSKAPIRPKQQRSRATLERLLAATESLLRHRNFSEITVADIVEKAASSVGAFYKRFSSKDALLPYLLARLQEQQLLAIRQFVADPVWQGVVLENRVREFCRILAQSYTGNRGLIRALVSRQFSDRSELPAEEISKARQIVDLIAGWLLECRAEIRHPEPDDAIRVGMFFTVTSLQVGILFRPATRRFSDALLVAELTRALLAYLDVPAAASPGKPSGRDKANA